MNIVKQHVLRGPNLYFRHPCLLTLVDLGPNPAASTGLPGFNAGLLELLPSLYDHRCSIGKYGGFVQALNEGTNLAHVLEHVTIALQCLAGTPTYCGRTHATGAAGQYRVVCSYEFEQLAVEACQLALQLVDGLASGKDGLAGLLDQGLQRLRELAERQAIGPSTAAILQAAQRQGIPAQRLTPEANLFLLGWGTRQKRLQATVTGNTSCIAVEIASDKQLTKALLEEAGIPVPQGRTVATREEALAAAQELGWPVALKPLDANHGRGVSPCCATAEDVAQAFARAREHSDDVIVERHIPGDDYRILVCGSRVVAAALRRPAAVIGDGQATVAALVEQENRNPARGEGHSNILTRIPLDELADSALAAQGLTRNSIPAAGQRVALRANANLSSGGTADDVTDLLPEQTRELCVRAVRKIGLDLAGIDLVCRDITRPLDQGNGAIIEINAAPGIRMHQYPSAGKPRDAGAAIVESMFGNGNGRIPIVAVTGTNGKTTTTLMIDHTLRRAGVATGCTTSEGVAVNGRWVSTGDCSGYWSARSVLADPDVEFAVLETARGGILKRGLAFDRCDVAVILNISCDHLGLDGVETLDDLRQVKAVVAEAASRAVVLNADDQHCQAIAATLQEVETIYFSCDAAHPVLARHLAQGGRAAWLEDGKLLLSDGSGVHCLLAAAEMPAAMGGCARHNIANGLAAAAALMASRVAPSVIADGLRSFVSDERSNPLRGNAYQVNGVKVIVDYAHNPAAFQAQATAARALAAGRTVAIATTPGDRQPDHFRQVGEICSQGFDEVIFYEARIEDRERAAGERARLMWEAGVAARGRSQGLAVAPDAAHAIRQALSLCRPGDVLVYACASSADELFEALQDLRPAGAGRIAALQA
jgi:cyanophycin synthetase